MKKFLPVALLLATLLPFSLSATSPLPKVAESVKPLQIRSLVLSEDATSAELTFRNICTVTSINQKLHLWLTAAHCVASEEDPFAISFEDFTIGGFTATVRRVDFSNDLAVLHTKDFFLPALKVATKAPTYGDTMVIWGHPFGAPDLVYVRGFVAAPVFNIFDKQFLLFSAPIAPGNSGSAVLNARNEVVSVAQVVFAYFPAFEPVGGGAPFSVLKEFLVGVM